MGGKNTIFPDTFVRKNALFLSNKLRIKKIKMLMNVNRPWEESAAEEGYFPSRAIASERVTSTSSRVTSASSRQAGR